MTEQEKQKLKDALIEAKHIHPTEYDDEDAFVGICFSDLVDIIDNIMNKAGWHPASELPPLDEDGCSGEVVVIASEDNDTFRHGPMVDKPSTSMVIDKEWDNPNVKWWCYPPKEE